MNANDDSHTLNSNPLQPTAAHQSEQFQGSKSQKQKNQYGITTHASNTMTSSGLSAVATTASSGGVKRQKEDKNASGQTTLALKDGEKQSSTKAPHKDKEQKTGEKVSGQVKIRKTEIEKKREKDEKEKEKEEASEPWWPPFHFDGRNALKSKLVLNLRNCQYDLFRDIALKELGWKIVDYRNRVIEHDFQLAKQRQKEMEEEQESDDANEIGQADSKSESQKQDHDQNKIPKDPEAFWKVRNDLDPDNWDIYWADGGMTPEFLSSLAPCQRVNHYLGMYNICRKSTLGMHLKRFQKEFPDHYNFFPPTWIYPAEFHDIQEYTKRKQDKRREKVEDGLMRESEAENEPVVLFICKPESGSQGRGIFIAQKVEEMRQILNRNAERERDRMNEYLKVEQGIEILQHYSHTTYQKQKEQIMARQIEKPQNQYIVQKYVKKPALYKGHKYDFRIYVLITQVISPMTIYLYNDGLVRLASQKYEPNKNFDDAFTHLTNYSLNKNNKEFDAQQHKLRLKDVLKGQLVSEWNGKVYRKNATQIWSEIEQIVIKTMYVVQPQLAHLYRTSQAKEPDLCCDLLGFDVMLDYKLKPWMLEVNHMPSFRADTDLDYQIKHDLIRDTLQILQLSIESRRQLEVILKQEKNLANQYGNLRRMTVKEHSERVRFDHNLIDKYLPRSNFKRIFPIDPGSGGVAANGDHLEDLYAKLEKSAQTVWKKQVGMINKKDENQNIHEKPKKRKKYRKNQLTSMTSHVKDKKEKGGNIDDNDNDNDDDEREEDPEDADDGLAHIEEEEQHDIDEEQIRVSTMSLQENAQNGGTDLKHVVSSSGGNRRNAQGLPVYNRQSGQNQSQSSLSQNKNLKGQPGKQNFNNSNNINLFNNQGNKKNEQGANNKMQEEMNSMPRQVQVPTLNEILTQLHQDPGFRQRYKEYCRAVLDGRFSFGGIKNPIYDHIYGSHGIMQVNQNRQNDGVGYSGTSNVSHHSNQSQIPGVTLLSNNARHQSQVRQHPQNQRDKRAKLDTIPHGQQIQSNSQPTTSNSGPTISEAAYFIQRVNRILQNQGDSGGQQQAPNMSSQYGNHIQAPNPQYVASTYSFNFIGNNASNNQSVPQQSSQSQMHKYNLLMNQQTNNDPQNPYLGLAIQSVNQSPNYQGDNQVVYNQSQYGNHQVASYANAIKQMQLQNQQIAIALGQQASHQNKVLFNAKPQLPINQSTAFMNQGRTQIATANQNGNMNQQIVKKHNITRNSQNTQKAIKNIVNLQENGSTQRQSVMMSNSRDQQSVSGSDSRSQAHQNMQKTMTKLINSTVTQHPGQTLPSKKIQQQLQPNFAQQMSQHSHTQHKQFINEMVLNKNQSKNGQQFSDRANFNESQALNNKSQGNFGHFG